MRRNRRNQCVFWASVVGFLPFAYASSYVARGPTPAEGCSGSKNEDETGIVTLSRLNDLSDVSSDGFFVFEARVRDLEASEVLAAITVEVRDADGELVPGETRVLKEAPDYDESTSLMLGWTASGAARSEDESLAFHAAADSWFGPLTLDASLTVYGSPPTFELPVFRVTDFSTLVRDRGAAQACETNDSCNEWISFGAELERLPRMNIEAQGIEQPVLVAWEYVFTEIPGKGSFATTPEPYRPFNFDFFEWVDFQESLDEYCIRVLGRDLKTGDTDEQELCASQERSVFTAYEDQVAQCSDPPPDFVERWCRAIQAASDESPIPRAECEPYLVGSAGSGGDSNEAGSAGAGATTPNPGAGGTGGDPFERPLRPLPLPGGSPDAGSDATPGDGEPSTPAGPGLDGGLSNHPDDPDDAGDPDDADGPRRVITKGGCGCRTAADPGGRNGALASAGALALLAGLGLRRRRDRDERWRADLQHQDAVVHARAETSSLAALMRVRLMRIRQLASRSG